MSDPDPLAAATRLANWIRSTGLVGYDPYDALSSPLLARLARSKRLRQVAIQSLRRLPVNVRPLLGIRPAANAKGLALIAAGAAKLHVRTGDAQWRELAEEAAETAISLGVETDGGLAWGYPFDVQVRWGYYSAGTPNVIATVFVADSLLRVAELLESPERARIAARAAPFLDSLVVAGPETYYAYVPRSRAPIHNANVLAASLRARLAIRAGEEVPALIASALEFSLCRQRSDGSWPYGEAPGLEWVDGFHTAYVLSALSDVHAAAPDDSLGGAIARGAAYYIDAFFEADGAPRYYPHRRYPIDAHNAATAIRTLVQLGPYEPRAAGLARRVLVKSLELLQTKDGWFLYQRGRMHAKRVPYLRWSDAHMLSGLGEFVLQLE